MTRWLLSVSKNKDSLASLGSPCWCPVTHVVTLGCSCPFATW